MANEIIMILEDKQYRLDKILVSEIHGKKINKTEKEVLQIEIKTLTEVLKLYYKNIVKEQRSLLNWMKKNHYLSKTEEQVNEIILEYNSTLKNAKSFELSEIDTTSIDKAIKVIKGVRKIQEYHNSMVSYCRNHNMTLDEIKHIEIDSQLRRLCSFLQNEFETGHVQ